MNFLPKFKRCPSCNSINLIRVNGIEYKNEFSSLSEWTLKKIINCKKCRVKLGLFFHNHNHIEQLIWIDYLKCEDNQIDKLNKLQKNKIKYKEKDKRKEYLKTIKQIQDIQNQIRLDQTKVKIKVKIQNRGMLI